MRVLITGAAGMIGRKLTARIIADGAIGGQPVTELQLFDVVLPQSMNAPFAITERAGNLTDIREIEALAAFKPDLVFHLAGVVSGEAETDFEKGMAVNFDASRALFLALQSHASPKIVFSSSIAVYGGPYPDIIPDDFNAVPQNSYGMEKLMSELLLADLSRRGGLDGISLRLPTICVRPGKPNAAASGFFSSIIREPLAGKPASLPVPRDIVHTHASPRAAVNFLLHAAALDTDRLKGRRSVVLPGVAVSVQEQIDALSRFAGAARAGLIEDRPDPAIHAIVARWPTRFEARRSRDLGFEAETEFGEIIKAHVDDELGGVIAPL